MDPDQRARLRLASTWAIQSSREIVNTCITIAAQWQCLRKTRSNDGCETSTRSRNKARDVNCTTKRSVGSSLAYRPRTSSDFGHGMPVASVQPADAAPQLCRRIPGPDAGCVSAPLSSRQRLFGSQVRGELKRQSLVARQSLALRVHFESPFLHRRKDRCDFVQVQVGRDSRVSGALDHRA